MPRILVFLVIFFALEIFILVQFAGFSGSWPMFLFISGTAFIGYILVRQQGTTVLSSFKDEITVGRIPAHQVLEGISLLFAALLLFTPGFITDIIGGVLMVPWLRALITNLIEKRVRRRSQSTNNFTIDGTYTNMTDTQNSISTANQSLPPTR